MILSRRTFLRGAVGGLAATAGLTFGVPSTALAGRGNGKVIFLVNLAGGADGLGMYPFRSGPVADQINTRNRPTLRVAPANVRVPAWLNQAGMPNEIGFHPGWDTLIAEAAGNMRIIKSIGFVQDPGRSHETCQGFNDLGARNAPPSMSRGWIGRLMDANEFLSLQVMGFDTGNRIAFNADREKPIIVNDLNEFDSQGRYFGGYDCGSSCRYQYSPGRYSSYVSRERDDEHVRRIRNELLALRTFNTPAEIAFKSALDTVNETVDIVQNQINDVPTVGTYPGSGFGGTCRDAAKAAIFSAGHSTLGGMTKLFYLLKGGWDNHSGLVNALNGNVPDVAQGLRGLVQDMKAAGIWANCAIFVFTEFNRTTFENESSGTDHAWGNNMLVLGGAVRPGVAGDDPSVSELNSRNYITPTVCYRRPLIEMLQWGGLDPSAVFNEDIPGNNALGIFA